MSQTQRRDFTFMHWRRKWQPTPVFLPGESQGWGSLVGCRLQGRTVGHDWSNLAVVAAATCKTELHGLVTTWTSKYYACCFGGTDKIQLPNKLFLFLFFILLIFIDFILVKRIGNLIFCKVGTFLIKEGERNTNTIAGRFSWNSFYTHPQTL